MKRLAVVVAAAVIVCGVAGYAIALPNQGSTKVRACAKKSGGALRLAKRCRAGERRVTWAKAGPTGPAGVAGPAGPAGADGKNGADGAPGTNATDGTDGTSTGETLFAADAAAEANFGTGPCVATPAGPSITFDAPAGSYVQVLASASMVRQGGTANEMCLNVDGTNTVIMQSTSLVVQTRYVQQGTAAGTTDRFASRPLVFPVTGGPHTISLVYGATGGTSLFSNRNLWVTLFHPAG